MKISKPSLIPFSDHQSLGFNVHKLASRLFCNEQFYNYFLTLCDCLTMSYSFFSVGLTLSSIVEALQLGKVEGAIDPLP